MSVGHKEHLAWIEDMLALEDRRLLRELESSGHTRICRACEALTSNDADKPDRSVVCPRCHTSGSLETKGSLLELLSRS